MARWTPAADIYSFDVVIWCICNLRPKPASPDNFPPIPAQYPPKLQILIDKCVEHKETKRPSISEVLSILQDLDATCQEKFLENCPEELLEPNHMIGSWSKIIGPVFFTVFIFWLEYYLSKSEKSWPSPLLIVAVFGFGIMLGLSLPQPVNCQEVLFAV